MALDLAAVWPMLDETPGTIYHSSAVTAVGVEPSPALRAMIWGRDVPILRLLRIANTAL